MDPGKGVPEKKGTHANDVVLHISEAEEASFTKLESSNTEGTELQNLRCRVQASTFTSSPSPEIVTSNPTLNKPPKIPAQFLTQRKSLARSEFSKPKSRLVEPYNPNDAKVVEEKPALVTSSSPYRNSPNVTTPKENLKSTPVTPRTPLIGSPGDEDEEDEDEDVYKSSLKHRVIWGLELWKWCVLIVVIFCGRLFTGWFMNILVFSIERNFLLKKKVLYFVYGLRRSVRVFVWLGVVLLAWGLLFNHGVKRSEKTTKILNYITRALGSCLIASAIWLLKTLLVKLLASSFQATRFFDRIQESIFHQYILKTLSGPPLMEMAEQVGRSNAPGQLSFMSIRKENKQQNEEVIDVEKLKKMKQEKVSAWTMKGLINVISGSGLSTISNALDNYEDEEGEQKDKEITSEWEAKAAAYQIFRNVAKPRSKYIDEEDLLRFMKKEEVDNMIPLFEGAAETRKIKRSTFKNWVVNAYLERKSLAHTLNDTKTAIEELNKLISGVVVVVAIVVGLLIMGFLTTQILVFISSQLLLVAFMFGNTAKTVFEAIIFVFVMHPYDVGDRCVIDGVQMIVEEVNILTTVFLRFDNEKIFYPNSVLATKPISNFYRSPEMSDSVEFSIDVSTSFENIGALKSKIKAYLESKPQHWRPGHSVVVKDIEDVNKMKMGLYVTHTINFQNYGDKNSRRSELVLELKKIFEELNIRYHLLPQEVQVSYVGSAVPPRAR
ncbi:hypothetical protein Patl1_13550 [Pistacia atlantica]|uniref:Uncharacterized protein n=1 Tax=Pistacia atlantica TaxID=434234 RepID=A0ACC1AVI7_9ROSI|nr:hypothetical protein Patl1_13550 [Pistacia atlantica]